MWKWKFRIRYADVAATLALIVASGGTAYAAAALPRNSVGTPQLQAGAVTTPKLHDNAVKSAKVSDGAITRNDLAEGSVGTTQLGDGSITTVKIGAGQITEGHLAQGAVRSAAVLDESLSVSDIAGGQVNLNLGGTSLDPGVCGNFTINGVTGAQPGQLAVAGWLGAAPAGIVGDARVTGTNQIGYRICNFTNALASFPGGTGIVRVITFG